MEEESAKRRHFINQIIDEDLQSGKHAQIITRFPPEPNGYLHLGHAKSICLNFGLAQDYAGVCHLRFDDTNPIKEEEEFVHAIIEDVTWLGFQWDNEVKYASDYFQQFYEFAVELIEQGKAYVDSLSADEIREYRGTLQEPGQNSPHRERSVEENLDLFSRMKAGEFANGEHVLRAKIDMASPNLNMRDPVLYRILHAQHQRTGDAWCIYPMYDFAHPLSDALEDITHSLCTLEFQDHRPLYDWAVENVSIACKPHQYEFARLNLSHTITSKRKLRQLVDEGHVDGWDDPRMPTLKGVRHRGYPAKAIQKFCDSIGVSKSDSIIDMSILEEAVRDELNQSAPRAMCVLNPLKVTIINAQEPEVLTATNHPNHPELGSRDIPFSGEIYIERDDFMLDPPKKFFRLAPGKEVRLRHAYVIKCEEAVTDDQGEVIELKCTLDPDTLGKNPSDRKVKGVIHWVCAAQAKPAEIRLYDRLFTVENPAQTENFTEHLNPNSLSKIDQALVEASLGSADANATFQFERTGYFVVDPASTAENLIFNRIVNLRDTWAKLK